MSEQNSSRVKLGRQGLANEENLIKIVELLVEKGVDVNSCDKY